MKTKRGFGKQEIGLRLAFFFEYYVGNVTFQKNLRESIEKDPSVQADWYNLEYEPEGLHKYLPIVSTNWSVRSAIRGRKILESNRTRFDGLFFHMQLPTLLSVGHLRRIPTVISMDATPINTDEIGVYYDHAHDNDFIHRLSFAINRRAFQAASFLVPWSEWAKRSLINHYRIPEEKIRVIPGGINLQGWTPREHFATNGPIRILFVGGDFERKGGKLLLDCFTKHLYPRFALDIITKDPVDSHPGVTVYNDLTPNSVKLKEIFAEANIFAMPTYGDASPWALLEAMASCLPVVTTGVGAIPEMVEHEKAGLLVPTSNGRALREAIEAIAASTAIMAKMGTHGRLTVERKFDAEKNGKAILSLMKTAMI